MDRNQPAVRENKGVFFCQSWRWIKFERLSQFKTFIVCRYHSVVRDLPSQEQSFLWCIYNLLAKKKTFMGEIRWYHKNQYAFEYGQFPRSGRQRLSCGTCHPETPALQVFVEGFWKAVRGLEIGCPKAHAFAWATWAFCSTTKRASRECSI